MKNLPYDENSIEDILKYTEKLIGQTFYDVLSTSFADTMLETQTQYYDNPRGKGSLGNLLEEHYFYYTPNSIQDADFSTVGLELKVTPYEVNKNGTFRAGERLVLSMIPNNEPIELNFEKSKLKSKISKILMIWYQRNKLLNRTNYNIDFVNYFDLYSEQLEKDLLIIVEDYYKIASKIVAGKAHELSEGDTNYLGACTKGSTAKKSLQPQFYNPEVLAKRRAFSFKQSYMTYVLNNYVIPGHMSYDSIFSKEELKVISFDEEIIKIINLYIGKSESDLFKKFNLEETSAKQKNKLLINRILGVETESAEEFEKANIIIKTVRVNKNNKPKESMSFPKINIMEFVQQDFEDSLEYIFFESTRILFVVFKEDDNGIFRLSGSKLWNMPETDIENDFKKEWILYKNKFITGVNFEIIEQSNGKIIIKNDLPKKQTTNIIHMRPHANKSAYLINGVKYGNGTESDMDLLPNGDKMVSQSFWLNNDYVAKIIQDII